MHSISRILAILLFVFVVTPAVCENRTVPSKPVVLMLMVESEVLATLQETFRAELAIELSTHTIVTESMKSLSSDGLSATLEDIRKIADAGGAEVVIWLEQTYDDKVSLNVLAAAPDRSMLRTVGATLSGKDTAGELAIAAREMLEELRINLQANRPQPQETATRSSSPDEQSASSDGKHPSKIDRSNRRRMELSLSLVTTGSVRGTAQSPILLGGALSVGLHWKSGLFADVSIDVFTHPSRTLQYGTLHTFGIRPGLGIGCFIERGPVTFGPYLGLQVPWQTAETTVGKNPESTDSWWNFRLVPSFDLRIRLHRNILLSMAPGLGILVHQEVFERATDGVDIYTSPYFEWHVKCGIIISLE